DVRRILLRQRMIGRQLLADVPELLEVRRRVVPRMLDAERRVAAGAALAPRIPALRRLVEREEALPERVDVADEAAVDLVALDDDEADVHQRTAERRDPTRPQRGVAGGVVGKVEGRNAHRSPIYCWLKP